MMIETDLEESQLVAGVLEEVLEVVVVEQEVVVVEDQVEEMTETEEVEMDSMIEEVSINFYFLNRHS